MATWKSRSVNIKTDIYEDYVDSIAHWEYQTTADVFSYHNVLSKNHYGYQKLDAGKELNSVYIGDDEAKILFQALASWIERYHSKKELDSLLKNNIFNKEIEND